MRLNDELLNRYIDGELSKKEMENVEKVLTESPDDLKNFKALKLVHQTLTKASPEETSPDFTSRLMVSISGIKKNRGDRFFILSIASVFIAISVLIVTYTSYYILNSYGGESSFNLSDLTTDGFSYIVQQLKIFSRSVGISILGAVFALSILVSGFFYFEHQKNLNSIKN